MHFHQHELMAGSYIIKPHCTPNIDAETSWKLDISLSKKNTVFSCFMFNLTCLSLSAPLHLLLQKKHSTNCSLHSNCALWQLLPHAVDLPLRHWVVQSQAQTITKILMHHDASSKSRLWMKQKRMEMLQANRILQSKWGEAPFNKKQWINSTYQLGARMDSRIAINSVILAFVSSTQ